MSIFSHMKNYISGGGGGGGVGGSDMSPPSPPSAIEAKGKLQPLGSLIFGW